jgi:hypothetical protein
LFIVTKICLEQLGGMCLCGLGGSSRSAALGASRYDRHAQTPPIQALLIDGGSGFLPRPITPRKSASIRRSGMAPISGAGAFTGTYVSTQQAGSRASAGDVPRSSARAGRLTLSTGPKIAFGYTSVEGHPWCSAKTVRAAPMRIQPATTSPLCGSEKLA